MRSQLIEWARIEPGMRVLDLGCGTGTLAVMTRSAHPEAEVVGLDGDPKALARARRKAERAGVAVELDEGLASELPYQDGTFDRVLSSFVFHHLGPDVKRRALAEVMRVLIPGGLFLLQDFGPPVTRLERWCASIAHQGEELRESLEGAMPELMREAGYTDIAELGQQSIRISRVWTYRAKA